MRDKGTVPAVCAGCRSPIRDQYILRVAPNLEWHAACLKCDECHVYLDESCTCFIRDGKPYCKRDFVRRFGAKCHRCNQGFTSNDFVMRVRENIFHLSCFRCTMCTRQLLPGEEFALLPEGLVCGAHIKQFPPASTQPDNQVTALRNPTSSSQVSSTSSSDQQKTTRVRTVLNDRQLRILRTCYNNNPRPDALMKEQMTKLTGLSARVIRVWFQNKRCKDKKKALLANSTDDMCTSNVADSPGDEKSKHVDVYMSGDSRDMLDANEMEFSPLTTTLDFNSSSASTSPSLSNPGCDSYSTISSEHHNLNLGERNLWTLNTSDFIPPYSMPPASSLDFTMPCPRSDLKSDLSLLAPDHPQV